VASAVAEGAGRKLRGELKRAVGDTERAIAATLKDRKSAILIGHYAQQHPDYSVILAIAQEIGRITGATVGILPAGANSVGAYLAGAVPRGGGLDVGAMVSQPRRGYLVAGLEAELDIGPAALKALESADFTVALSAYRNATTERAHVMLPIAPFTETGGTFVNMEGLAQSFNGVVKGQGDSRPGWKVLRMLGSLLELPGFHQESLDDVRREIAPDLQTWARQGLAQPQEPGDWTLRAESQGVERFTEFGLYATDAIVRRSQPLQRTAIGKAQRAVAMHPRTAESMKLVAGQRARVRVGNTEAQLVVSVDATLPEGVVRIARGVPETAMLAAEGALTLEPVAETVAA
jgi:NADH-quinone oxidoreductase subunit G